MTSLATSGQKLLTFDKRPKIGPLMASGGISRERFKQDSKNFTGISWTISPTNLQDMTSPAFSGWLENAIKYCTKVRKTGPDS